MGLLDKLKKGRTRRGQKEKQHQKQPFQQNLSQKTDPAICPGGAFMVQLFMKEKSGKSGNQKRRIHPCRRAVIPGEGV